MTGLGGFELYVKFEDGISRWVRYDEIGFLSDAPLLTNPGIRKPALPEKQFKARQIIESLKLGVVPYDHVGEFTFGRDKEISRIENWLADTEGGSLILSGEYGVGKTHFLEYVYSMALENGWAVSMVQLDPNELPLHKPKTIYEYIIHSFKFRNQNGDFREFLREIARDSEFYKLKKHNYLGKMVEIIRTDDESDDIWEWIEGKPTKSYRPLMYQPATCANIYCHILSGIGWAAKNILGLNGFLILFDEAESVDPFWFSAYQNNKGWNFLKGLVLMSKNDHTLIDEYKDGQIYSCKTYTGWWGHYTGLQYCGRSRLPFTWKTPCHLKTLFAFTPSGEVFRRAPLNNIEKYKIKHIGTNYLTNVSERIIALYNTAYDFQINADIFEYVPKDNTRKFIKGLIEALDLICAHPNKSIDELLDRHVEGGGLKSGEDPLKRFHEQHIEDEDELGEELTYEELLENMRAGAAALADDRTINDKLREKKILYWLRFVAMQTDIQDRHQGVDDLLIAGRIWGKLGSCGLNRDEIESYIIDKGYKYGEIWKYIKEHRDEL